MPALAFVPGVCRVVINGLIGGVTTANVMHVQQGATGLPWASGDVANLAAGVRAAWVTNFIPVVSSSWTLTDVTAIDLTSATGASATASGSTNGAVSGTVMPANVALCVSWKTSLHFRGGHCRTYLSGFVTPDLQNANTWTSTKITAVNSAATNFRLAIPAIVAAGPPVLVMVSRYSGTDPGTGKPIPRVTPLAFPVTGNAVDSRVDTMRRRLGKDR